MIVSLARTLRGTWVFTWPDTAIEITKAIPTRDMALWYAAQRNWTVAAIAA